MAVDGVVQSDGGRVARIGVQIGCGREVVVIRETEVRHASVVVCRDEPFRARLV